MSLNKPPQDSEKRAHNSLQVIKVEGKSAIEDFIRLVWPLYQDDPVWIPPLMLERKMQLSAGNPYFKHAQYCSWIASRNGNPVGRISAQIDRLYLDRYQNATGFFGMLESEDNSQTFQILLETAEEWLRKNGMQRISGPFNLSINQELGLLVNGFDTPPAVMMGHARPYYSHRIEENGYCKEKDLLAYNIDSNFAQVDKIKAIATRTKNRVLTRSLNKSNFNKELKIIKWHTRR